ncbi:MAG TPA: hypothetical protein VFX98_09955 [Longimicrobiaceae bacterium]|nr:hypothetical protein [Longimicrobiaceae bacterium]
MHDERIDLSALHPARRDPERWARLPAEIVARARRPAAAPPVRNPLLVLAEWAWPTLAAAAAVAGLSLVSLSSGGAEPAALPAGPVTVAEALELPAPVDDWIVEDRQPVAADLLVALDADDLPRLDAGAPEPIGGREP